MVIQYIQNLLSIIYFYRLNHENVVRYYNTWQVCILLYLASRGGGGGYKLLSHEAKPIYNKAAEEISPT